MTTLRLPWIPPNATLDPTTFALAVGLGWHPTGYFHRPWPGAFWHYHDSALPDCAPRPNGACWHEIAPSFPDQQTMPDLLQRALDLLKGGN